MPYKPNLAVHPGFSVSRALKQLGMSQKSLSVRTGLTEKHLSQIINGEASITVETALLFENAVGGAASFWINLEKNYQEAKARLERMALVRKEFSLLEIFPYSELAKRGYVPQTRAREERVDNLWRFFGVNSLQSVMTTEAVAFRRKITKNNGGAIAAWLRCGELNANKRTDVTAYSEESLRKILPELRHLSTRPASEFAHQTRSMLANSGVMLEFEPHFPGTGVSGSARWVGDNPIIQLSLLGAYADIFWFNLFHELGHLLLHGKKEKFVDFTDRGDRGGQDRESEADEFASNALIERSSYEKFLRRGSFSRDSVREFARSERIHPGIVEGRLSREQVSSNVSWSRPLGFRERLKFVA